MDAAFLAQQRALREARAARFAADAAKPPPPLPPKKLAHPGGKIVTSDKRAALLSLLSRQSSPPTAAQKRALAALDAADGQLAERWPQQNSLLSQSTGTDSRRQRPAERKVKSKRRRFAQLSRGLRLKLTPWARRTCTVTAFIFRRRRRIVMERMAHLLRRGSIPRRSPDWSPIP